MNTVLRIKQEATPVAPDEVRAQMALILSSEAFTRSPRMQRFLRFIVEETLAGREDGLCEYGIGVVVFDRGADFEPAADPIVRNDARRLRFKLLDYYQAAAVGIEQILIDIPKGGYVPVFAHAAAPQRGTWLPSSAPIRIAVLPFDVCSATPQNESGFARGLCALLTASLTNLDGLETVASAFVEQQSLQNASGDRQLSHVLQGSLLGSGENCRVILNLVQVTNGRQLWAGEYSFLASEMFEAQARIAQVVCDKAATRLGLSQRPVLMLVA